MCVCAPNISADQDQADLDVQRRISLDYKDIVSNYFIKTLSILLAIYTCSGTSWTFGGGSVPFSASKQTVLD